MEGTIPTFVIAIAIVVGIAGTLIPLVPGISLTWASTLVYGIFNGFGTGGWIAFSIITIIAICAVASNLVLPGRRAEKVGAANTSIVLGVFAALVGLFVIPIIGFPLGGALGMWIGERLQGRPAEQAWVVTKETLIGIGWSMLVQFVLAVWMGVVWVLWAAFA